MGTSGRKWVKVVESGDPDCQAVENREPGESHGRL